MQLLTRLRQAAFGALGALTFAHGSAAVAADGGTDWAHPFVEYHEGNTYSALDDRWVGPRRLLSAVPFTDQLPVSGDKPGVVAMMGAVSANGRWIAFVSSRKLTSDAAEGLANVYVMEFAPGGDRASGPGLGVGVELVSIGNTLADAAPCASSGTLVAPAVSNGASYQPSISEDGRFVAFTSKATNLVWHNECATDGTATVVPSAPDGTRQVYVRDRTAKTTKLISGAVDTATGIRRAGEGDAVSPAISANGKYVAYTATSVGLMTIGLTNILPMTEVYLARLSDLATARISSYRSGSIEYEPLGSSSEPAINADGRFVAFKTNVAHEPDRDLNNAFDVVVYESATDPVSGEILLGQRASLKYVSVNTAGQVGNSDSGSPSISADGNRIAYMSRASNLIDPTTPLIDAMPDTNGVTDVYVRDMATQRQRRASLGAAGWFMPYFPEPRYHPWRELQRPSFHPVISGDGKRLLFNTDDPYVLFDRLEADYLTGKALDGAAINGCYMAMFAWREDTWPMRETDPPSPPLGPLEPWPADLRTPLDVIRKGCLPPIAPDVNDDYDVFLVEVDDLLESRWTTIKPISVGDWRYGAPSYQQIDRRNVILPAGSPYWIQRIDYARHGFFQAEFGNAFSVVNSAQAMSYDGQTIIFDTAADNLQRANTVQADAMSAALARASGFHDAPLTDYGVGCDRADAGSPIKCRWMLEDQNEAVDVYYFSPANPYVQPMSVFGSKRPPTL